MPPRFPGVTVFNGTADRTEQDNVIRAHAKWDHECLIPQEYQ